MSSWNLQKITECIFCTFFKDLRFISMYSVLNTLSGYTFTYQNTFTYKEALLHTLLLLVFKIVKSHQCIFKVDILADPDFCKR